MLHNVYGIVLKCVRYGDTSVIVKAYTDKFGIQSYLINGVRATKSKNRQAMLQSLTLLNMVVYHREHKNLQRVREMNFDHVFATIPFDIRRGSIALFMTEILNKTLREETANPELFDFVRNAIRQLDDAHLSPVDLHVHFLARLSTLLGFAPSNIKSSQHQFFDLEEGSFVAEEPVHYHVVQSEDAQAFARLFDGDLAHEKLTASQRRRLLDGLLLFFRLHVEGFGQVKSHKILQTVLN